MPSETLSSALTEFTPAFYAEARYNMLESQLRPNGILDDGLLEAMGRLPRELFVAEDQKSFAYSDDEVSAGFGRKLLKPMVLARLIQACRVGDADRVLVLGAVTGYGAAVAHELAGEVIALESDVALLRQLQQNKHKLGLENLRMAQGDLSDGYPQVSPYQVILIEGGVQWLPDKIGKQLDENGRLACVFYPEGDTYGKMGQATLFEKRGGILNRRVLFDCSAPLLSGFVTLPKFSFA